MGHAPNSYLGFAENDYAFFRDALDHHIRGNALAAMGQSICERYLKHIISEYAEAENSAEQADKEHILRTHSLQKLMKYIHEIMEIEIPEDVEIKLERINGFYFATRYPGDESFFASERDIDKAEAAVESAREFTLGVCRKMEETAFE